MDVIFIEGYRAQTLIGIYDWERLTPQPVELDIEIGLIESLASKTDEIADTVDYGRVVARVREILDTHSFSLLERLAEHIAQTVISEFNSAWVKLSLAKIDAISGVKRLGIRIERKR